MEAERSRVAREFRSQGAEAAERIRADADKQKEIIIAEAYRDAEKLRGQGDAKSADIYAGAYKADPEFYDFYRSINAYQRSFNNSGDVLVIEPDSDFFKYFKKQK
jgi:membrane protease subunit HflC